MTLSEYEAARCTVQAQRLSVVMGDLYEQHAEAIDALLAKLWSRIHDATHAVETCYSFVFEDEKLTGVLAFFILYELVMKGGYSVYYRSVGDYSMATLDVKLYATMFMGSNDLFGFEKRIEVCVSGSSSRVKALTNMVLIARALGLLEE